MTNPYLPYAITEAYCIVFAVTVWLRMNSSMGSEHEVRQLRNMIYSYVGMLSTDIFWALSEGGILSLPLRLNAFLNAVTIMSVACGCYFWFRFIEDRLHFPLAAHKTLHALLCVPVLSLCALDLISIYTGWIFYIDAEGHYQSTSLFVIHTAVNYFYLVIPTSYSLYRACKTRSKQERAEYGTYALYMVAPLLSGLLEDTFPRVPLLALNIFMMILILFLMIQNMQVYNDALTGLNNRRRLNRYLEECLPRASARRPILLFIMDIDSFKAVNDDYGHQEGDRALKTFSGVLREVAARYSAFVARYGGDEFCMVMDAAGCAPEKVAEDIHRSLLDAQSRDAGAARPYTLTVSIGCAVCDSAESAPDAVLARADRRLYEEKQSWHAERRQKIG